MVRRGQGDAEIKVKKKMKERVKFETSKISSDIDPSGSYKLHITERPIYDETRVFGEVVTEKHLPFDEDLLQFAFLAVLTTVSKKVSKDCNPRKIGNYLKFLPTIRGKVKGPYSAYNPATCSTGRSSSWARASPTR